MDAPRRKPTRFFTMHDIHRLIDMRDRQGMKWIDIAAAVGRTGTNPKAGCATCYSAYKYWKEKLAQPAKTRAAGTEPTKWETRRAEHPAEVSPDAVTIAAAPIVADLPTEAIKRRPSYFSDADNDIRARIARQGLTAGFLGDPPPGRSALDQREAGK